MNDASVWDTSTGVDALRRVHIIDDLLGAVLLFAAAALALALELTRRQVCAVYQLAFALCASWAFFIVGGLVDHHVSDDQLSRALYGSYLSSTQYTYLPVAASVLVSLALVLQLSSCDGCECCCCTVGTSRVSASTSSSHKQCFEGRVRSQASLYVGSVLTLFVAIGTRLNVRLRGSAINPIGGTVHWTMLRSPCYLSVIHTSALVLIALKVFLQHADNKPLGSDGHFQRLSQLASLPLGLKAPAVQATAAEDLMRSPLVTKPRRSIEPAKSALTRSPRSTSSLPSPAATLGADTSGSKSKSVPTDPPRRAPVNRYVAATSLSQRQRDSESRDGDVSSLISSDSENDEDVLQPSFKTTGPGAVLPPLHRQQQHHQLGLKSRSLSSRNLSHSSSPPLSPVSTASSASSSAFSFSSMTSFAATTARQQQQQQRARTARPRSSSSISSTSTTNLLSSSDSDELSSSFEGRRSTAGNYYRDRPVSASVTAASLPSYGLRRRGAAQILTLHATIPALESEWLECFDPVSGSAYYYNQVTGESRWER